MDGIDAALSALEERTEDDGSGASPLQVEVRLSSFAGDVTPWLPDRGWHRLNRGSLHELLAETAGYRTRANGRDTDYVMALTAARRALNTRAAETEPAAGEGTACKLLLFLSDGRFELGDRTGATALPPRVFYAPEIDLERPGAGKVAVRRGHRYLCRPGGLMDRIVRDRIVMFTVALSAAGSFDSAARSFLDAITTGRAEGKRCGVAPSHRTGEFTEVRDSRDLFFAIGALAGSWPVTRDCRVRPCPNPSKFTAIPGLSGFVISTSSQPGLELALSDPGRQVAVFSSGGPTVTRFDGASIQQRWFLSRSVGIRAKFDPDSQAWIGAWRFRFFFPGEPGAPVPAYSLGLESELRPEIVGEPLLVKGRKTSVEVEMVGDDGTPVRSGRLVRSAHLVTDVVDGSRTSMGVDARSVGEGRFRIPISIPDDPSAGDWSLSLETRFAIGATPVEPTFVSLPLPAPVDADGGGTSLWVPALILAALIAVGVLAVGMRARSRARFTPERHLRVFACDVLVGADRHLELTPDPRPSRFEDFKPLSRRGSSVGERRIESGAFSLRALARRRGQGVGRATAGGWQIVGGTQAGPLSRHGDGKACEVPLDLAGTWLFAAAPTDAEGDVRGKLVVFAAEEAPADLGPKTLELARAGLAQIDWSAFDRDRAEDSADPLAALRDLEAVDDVRGGSSP